MRSKFFLKKSFRILEVFLRLMMTVFLIGPALSLHVNTVNALATDITLTSSSINENEPINTIVGILGSNDPDLSATFSLEDLAGHPDNAAFDISGDQLITTGVFDFETQPTYTILIRVTDSLNDYYQEEFIISVTDVNETPTSIDLSNDQVAENEPIDTVVGTLTSVDPDGDITFTYTLEDLAGHTDNAAFDISGDQLITKAVFNFESQSSYSILIRTTDGGGLSFDKEFTITVTDVNETPTSIDLSNDQVAENEPVDTLVGTLTSVDPDIGNTFTYTLEDLAGHGDNAAFDISGDQLITKAVFNFESQPSYSILIRTTDGGGLSFDKEFTITVTDVNETPTDINLSSVQVAENEPVDTVVGTLTSTDPDGDITFTYTLEDLAGHADNAAFDISGDQLITKAVFNFESQPSYSILIRTTDGGGLSFDKEFTITVNGCK